MLKETSKKLLTLCFIQQDDKILLGMKKRGMGEGKWNGFGGKVEEGESIEDATKREVLEECGITVSEIEKMGALDFTLPNEERIWQVHIFKAIDFTGEPIETEEMKPQWFPVRKIPYVDMWADDKYWFPLFLQGKRFEGRFIFDEEFKIIKQKLSVIPASEPESRQQATRQHGGQAWMPEQVGHDSD